MRVVHRAEYSDKDGYANGPDGDRGYEHREKVCPDQGGNPDVHGEACASELDH